MRTEFSFEVPLKHLYDFDGYQDLIFALSFLFKEEEYVDYVNHAKSAGRRLIIDNSYNELNEPDKVSNLVYLFKEFNADMVVSPDSDRWDMQQLVEAYRDMVSILPRDKVIVVVRNEEEWRRLKKEGVVFICTTFYHRPNLAPTLLADSYHFLGLANESEISSYRPISCDTSMPIKLALECKTMEDWKDENFPHIHTRSIERFFDLEMTKTQLKLAKENIEWLIAKTAL